LLLIETFVSDCWPFLDIYYSQGSVATQLRCGGIFNDRFITGLLMSPRVKNFENWSTIGKVMEKIRLSCLLTHGVCQAVRVLVAGTKLHFYRNRPRRRVCSKCVIVDLSQSPTLSIKKISSKSVHSCWSYQANRQIQ